MGDCAPKILFTDPGLEETSKTVAASTGVAHVVTANSDRSACSYESAIEGREPVTEIVDLNLDDLLGQRTKGVGRGASTLGEARRDLSYEGAGA